MRKRIWKWTKERQECDDKEWSVTCCCLCVIVGVHRSVCICYSVFFHSQSIGSPWFWSGDRSDLSVLCSPLCSWTSCRKLHHWLLDVCVPQSCVEHEGQLTSILSVLGEGQVTRGRNIFHAHCGLVEVPITAVITIFLFSWTMQRPSTGSEKSTFPFTVLWKGNSS